MNEKDAALLSNASVVDIMVIDELAEKIDYQDPITPQDIFNLASLVESFVLSNEVVIRDQELILDDMRIDDLDFTFTQKWIEEFHNQGVIKFDNKSAAILLSNDYVTFDKSSERYNKDFYDWLVQPVENMYTSDIEETSEDFETSFREMISDSYKTSTEIWNKMTSFYGVPFLTTDINLNTYNSDKITNISMDLYRKMEKYYDKYFKDISKFLGPTYIRIPFLLSLVLKNCSSLEDIPAATMDIRNKFSEFNMETTELEYQLRTSKSIFNQIKIVQLKEQAYENIVNKFDYKSKRRIQTRVFDIVQSLDPKTILSETIKNVRELNVEENGLLLIPGYYDIWRAFEDVEQALPELKRLFGKQLDKKFFSN